MYVIIVASYSTMQNLKSIFYHENAPIFQKILSAWTCHLCGIRHCKVILQVLWVWVFLKCLRGIVANSFGLGEKKKIFGFKPEKVSQKYLNQYGEHKLCNYLVICFSFGNKWHHLLLACQDQDCVHSNSSVRMIYYQFGVDSFSL